MRKPFVLLLVLWGLSTATLWAQHTEPVTIDLASAADLSLRNNLAIKASRQDINTANKVVEQVKGYGKAHVDLNASYYRLSDPITLESETIYLNDLPLTIPGQTVADQNPYFAHVSASYPLYDAGRVRYGTRSATYKVAEAQNTAKDTELSTVLQTTRTYLAAIYGRENIRVNEEALKSYEQHLAQARKSRDEGVATDYDVTRAEAAVEDQNKQLTEVRNQYELALANLRTALLLPKDTPINLKGSFFSVPDQPSVDEAESAAVGASPLLRSIKDKSNSLQYQEKSVKAENKPQLDAVGFANLLNRSSGFLTDPQWFLGVQLALPIFDGGITRARAQQVGSERVKNDIELENVTNDTKLSIQSAYLDMSTASSAISSAKKSVALAKESLRLAERRFAEGVGTSLEVFDANVNLLAAQTGLQQSLYQYDSAYLTAHRYIGDLIQVAREAQATE